MSSSNPDTSGFTSTVAGLDKSKPLFIVSHMPLHERRNDNYGAAAWYTAISAAAESMDIVFFWAHNHTGENEVDQAAYYVAKNGTETMAIEGGSTVTPNFTYMNAGFIGQSAGRGGYVTTVEIYSDSMVFQDYNSSGAVSDNSYTHNVEVVREFASSTDSGDGDGSTDTTDPTEGEEEGGSTTETKDVYVLVDTMTVGKDYLIANGNSGTVTLLGQSSGGATTTAAEVKTSGNYTYIESADSGYVWNATAHTNSSYSSYPRLINAETYAMYASGGSLTFSNSLTSTSGAVYTRYWTYSDGQLACVSTNSGSTTYYLTYSDGYSMTSTATDGIYIYEKQTITVNSDGTSSGGDSTEDGEDDTTTGGSTDTTHGEGTYNTADDGSYQKVTFGTEGEEKTVYVLVSTPTAGNQYLIVSGNSAGSAYALKENTTTGSSVAINAATDSITAPYIETSDETIMWNAASGMTFQSQNGSYYLRQSQSGDSRSLSFSTSQTTDWTVGTNTLSYEGKRNTYYVSGGSTWSLSNSSANVYFYEKQTVNTSSSVTYSVTASDIKHVFDDDATNTETAKIETSVDSAISGGTYSYTIVSDESSIISGDIATDGTVTFTGNEGTATVKVVYTFTQNDVEYTIWDTITIEASEPYYTLDLHKADVTYTKATNLTAFVEGTTYYTKNEDGTYTKVESDAAFDSSVTYYTISYTLGDEITAPIAIKGVEEGDKYGVWAVVKYYDGTTEGGTDMGVVDIEWSSSDETIATVDKNTGIITFTGKEGTVNITATYLNGNKPSDTITISVSPNKYSLPADGTSDFPEYPNEGAIRYDKTATAVGNFSETGIAQVELSMTGVPYSTGSEIDVVIMLDMTGSMNDDSIAAARAAAIAFADQIIKNEDGTYNNNRISVQQFNKNGVTELWALSAVTADTYNALTSAINSSTQASGGTPYSTALKGCKEILDAARTDGTGNDRQQFCVFVSDGTPTSYTDVDGGSDTTKKEYYSNAMQEDGVTVYGVYTSAAAGSSGSGGGSVNDTEEGTAIMQNVASSDDKVYVVEDYTDTSALTGVFTDIAMDILQAATDVTVEDQITKEYTMIFDIPTGTQNITGLDSQEFYIEFVKYTLDENHERTDTVTSVTKLYLGTSNGTYYAASDASGTAYAAPVFAQSTIGDKGTLYYWTTDSSYASKAAVTYTSSGTTYYFIPYGMEAESDGSAPDGWYNMTSGAYASGTIDSTTNMSTDLVIATPYFVYNAGTKMLYWTVDKLDNTEYALRYFLYLDDSATEVGTDKEVDAATYPTNDHAYITYTNFKGNDCRREFPIPQLTWNGAQVSYVFYLVNSAGQPINKSGQVVDFANAVFVTDVYTKAVVWNKGDEGTTGTGELSADWLAEELLPDEYTIYDELAGFELNVYEKADGTTIKNQFTIEGDTAANISTSLNNRLKLETTESSVSVTTTKVYNTKAGQKVTGYGTYYSTDANMAGIDFSNVTVAFAVVWESKLVEDVVVVDYGLDVLINVVQNDLLQNTVSGIGTGNSAYGEIAMNTGVIATAQLSTADLKVDGNTISLENENQIRFSQNDMTFTEPVEFYYESPAKFYENSEQKTGYMYSKVTVIPATTIYYEDDFLTYEGAWTVDGTEETKTQDQDRPGASQISAALDADNNYGYDSAYTEMSQYSLGAAHKVTVSGGNAAQASFEFYGTGFDVISLTSNTTGTIMVDVYAVAADGTVATEKTKSLTVDTYYGYTQNADGDWVMEANNPNALYQVPVMKVEGLTYGRYKAVITAAYAGLFDHNGTGSYDFYLDAIRIYDPTGNQNDIANEAYVADGEGWPLYEELRNNVINAYDYNITTSEDGTVTITDANLVKGAIFIDSEDDNLNVADYVSYGPNNELYLAEGQAIAFNVSTNDYIVDVQLGIKIGNGNSVTYKINDDSYTVKTATDMYYSILSYVKNGTVVIQNTSGGILSLTNIKVTYTQDPAGIPSTTSLLWMDEETSTYAVMSLRSAAVEEPDVEVTEPEETQPEQTEPEATEPEVTEPEATEPEATEPEATEPEATEPDSGSGNTGANVINNIINKITSAINSWLSKWFR